MSDRKDGGVALLDYFAAKAMQGLLSTDEGYRQDEPTIARLAYSRADAMMAEKQRRLNALLSEREGGGV
jgi:hypothetical protein